MAPIHWPSRLKATTTHAHVTLYRRTAGVIRLSPVAVWAVFDESKMEFFEARGRAKDLLYIG